jgi:hypothetical protein
MSVAKSHGFPWDRTWASAARRRRLTGNVFKYSVRTAQKTNPHLVYENQLFNAVESHQPLAFRRVGKLAESDYLVYHACLSVRPSVCSDVRSRLPMDEFSLDFISQYFSKICRKNSSLIKN